MAKEQGGPVEDGDDSRAPAPGRLVADRATPPNPPPRSAVNATTLAIADDLPTEIRAALERVPGLVRAEHGRADLVVGDGAVPPPAVRADGPAVLVVGDAAAAHPGWVEVEVDAWISAEALVADAEGAVRRALAAQLALRAGPGSGVAPWLRAIATVTGASALARITPDAVEWWPGPHAGVPVDAVAAAARTGVVALPSPEAVASRLDVREISFGGLVALPLGPRVADGVLVALSAEGGVPWMREAVPALRQAAAVSLRETLVRRALAAEAGRRWIEKVLHRLLSVVSHDLRNPLFAVQLGVKILERQHGRTEQIATIQNTIATATQLLRRLVDAGRQVLEVPSMPPVGFGADVLELWDRVVEGAQRRHPGRAIAGAPDAVHVAVDPVMLERVLVAVVDNALQHATGPDPVTVASRVEGGNVVLELRNRGRLPFVDSDRVEPFEHRSNGGIGVGLYVARRTARAAGVRVRVRQDGPDVETTVVLPAR